MLLLVGFALADEPLVLTYEQALKAAALHSPRVLAAVADVRAAEGAVASARADFEPSFDAGVEGGRAEQEGQFPLGDWSAAGGDVGAFVGLHESLATGTTLGVELASGWSDVQWHVPSTGSEAYGSPAWSSHLELTLRQSLLEGVSLRSNLRGVRAVVRARSVAEARRAEAREDALQAAANAYWRLSLARAARFDAEAALADATALVDAARRLPPGERSEVDTLRAEVAVDRARAARDAREADAAAAEDTLSLALGEPVGRHIDLRTEPPAAGDPPETDVLTAVLQGNPTLLAARIEAQTARLRVDDARHALLPRLDATAAWGLRGYDPTLSGAFTELGAGDLPEWRLGATLGLPLFNLADRGHLTTAEAEAEHADVAARALEGELTARTRTTLRTLAAARTTSTTASAALARETALVHALLPLVATGKATVAEAAAALDSRLAANDTARAATASWLEAWVELGHLEGTL